MTHTYTHTQRARDALCDDVRTMKQHVYDAEYTVMKQQQRADAHVAHTLAAQHAALTHITHTQQMQYDADTAAHMQHIEQEKYDTMHASRIRIEHDEQRRRDDEEECERVCERARAAATQLRIDAEYEHARIQRERERELLAQQQRDAEAHDAHVALLARERAHTAACVAYEHKRRVCRRGMLLMRVVSTQHVCVKSGCDARVSMQLRFNAANLPSSKPVYTQFWRAGKRDESDDDVQMMNMGTPHAHTHAHMHV